MVPDITSYLPAGSSRYVVNVTDDIIFQCMATGVPPPDIQWYRGNVRLNSSTNSRYVIRDGGVSMPERSLAVVTNYLVINDTEESDTGDNYVCEAFNMANNGIDLETFGLFVQGKYLDTKKYIYVLCLFIIIFSMILILSSTCSDCYEWTKFCQ